MIENRCTMCGLKIDGGVKVSVQPIIFLSVGNENERKGSSCDYVLCEKCGEELNKAVKTVEERKKPEREMRQRHEFLQENCGRWIFCESEDWDGVADYKCPDCGAKHCGVDIYGPIPGVDCLKFCPECGESMEKQEDSAQQFTPEQIRDMETATQICKWYKEKLKERQGKLGKDDEQSTPAS